MPIGLISQMLDTSAAYSRKLKKGDRKAFEAIYREYREPLFYLALRYLKDKNLAEDALQDVFLKLWHNRESLNENLSLRGFLFTSMKRHLLNAIRSHKNEILKNTALAQRKEMIANDTENSVNYLQSQELIKEGISTLSAKKKEILELSLFEGLSHQEIALKLNLSEHTVRSQISQSTKVLRAFLGKLVSIFVILFI